MNKILTAIRNQESCTSPSYAPPPSPPIDSNIKCEGDGHGCHPHPLHILPHVLETEPVEGTVVGQGQEDRKKNLRGSRNREEWSPNFLEHLSLMCGDKHAAAPSYFCLTNLQLKGQGMGVHIRMRFLPPPTPPYHAACRDSHTELGSLSETQNVRHTCTQAPLPLMMMSSRHNMFFVVIICISSVISKIKCF